MSERNLTRLETEWVTLQNQYDAYEKYSLIIKLFSVLVCCSLLFVGHADIWTGPFIAILWLQDGIWKTFQNRIGQRLETVEQAIQHSHQNKNIDHSDMGMQFNSAWAKSRPNAFGLVAEYLKQCLKPTVTYPYIALIVLVLFYCCAV